jgi:hypothetical protein
VAWPAAAQAVTIISVDGPDSSNPADNPTGFSIGTSSITGDQQYFAVSWTQSHGYSDVAITALLSGSFRGLVHLTTALGPGATVADQVAVADFMIDLTTAERDDILLLSGLTLGPGTYFLSLAPSAGSSGNWWSEKNQATVLDAGVAFSGTFQAASPDNIDAAFLPASDFAPYFVGLTGTFSFAVTGERVDEVPEPATGLILAGAVVALGWIGRGNRLLAA